MSNPYAPPGDRPPEPPAEHDGPTHRGPAHDGPVHHGGQPGSSQPGYPQPGRSHPPQDHPQPDHTPEGVPYERRSGPRGPAPHPTDVRRVAVLTRTTALLVLLCVFAGLLAFPWYLAAVPLAVAAIVVGGRALTFASRTRVRGTPMGVVSLLIFVALMGLARPAQTVLMWDAERDFAECRGGAVTVQAQNDCLSQYEKAIAARMQELSGRS